jgi:hypothetical protein
VASLPALSRPFAKERQSKPRKSAAVFGEFFLVSVTGHGQQQLLGEQRYDASPFVSSGDFVEKFILVPLVGRRPG